MIDRAPLGFGLVGKLASWSASGQLLTNLRHLWRARRVAGRLRASGLFDPAWYGRDPEVAASGLDCAMHYVLRGAAEGRSPSPAFDGEWYLRRHASAAMAGANPLAHYLDQGRAAGLETRPAAPAAMPRTPLTDSAYRAWVAECDILSAPFDQVARQAAQREPDILVVAEDARTAGLERQSARHFAAIRGAGRADDRGSAVLFVSAGTRLAEHAVLAFQLAMQRMPGAGMIYADEDRVDERGRFSAPWFKPDWDPDLMLACDLAGPAVLFRRGLLDTLGWDGRPLTEAALRDMTLRAAAIRSRVAHVAIVVAHRIVPPAASRLSADPATDIRMVARHLAMIGSSASIQPAPGAAHLNRVSFALPARPPLVSVIVPTRDHARLLRKAVDGVLQRTDYPRIELIVVDNDSRERRTRRLLGRLSRQPRVRVIQAPGQFNWSAMNNRAARVASGDVLVMLNNDVEVVSPDWLTELVTQAMRPEIGAAGAKLLYPDGTVQHAGIAVGPAALSCHVLRGSDGRSEGPHGELAVTRTVSAVTGACLAMRRAVFEEVGGLEAGVLGTTHNDIDLCLRVRQAGYRVVLAPASVLLHREAQSRGPDVEAGQLARVQAERAYLVGKWGALVESDPYLNPNLCMLRNRLALEAPAHTIRRWAGSLPSRSRNETREMAGLSASSAD